MPGSDLAASLVTYLEGELHLKVRLGERLAVVKHAVTNRRITLTVFEARLAAPLPRSLSIPGARWVLPGHAGRYPLAAAASRILEALTQANSRAAGGLQVEEGAPLKS